MNTIRNILLLLLCICVAQLQAQYSKAYATILSSSENETVVKIHPQGFEQIALSNGAKISLQNGTSLLKEGYPDVQKLAFSLIIPDKAKMKLEVLASNFYEIANLDLLPSKGNLPRTINPDDVAYKYGEVYQENAFFPKNIADLQTPYILRDFRGQTVWVYPTRYNPVTKTLRIYKEITLKITQQGEGGENVLQRTQPLPSIENEFANIYRHQFANAQTIMQYIPVNEEGEMLVITDPSFMTDIQPLINWKKEKGIRTTLVDVSTIGANANAIKSYIQTYYGTHNLKYVTFVGDNAQIPAGSVSGNPSDTQYGYLAGNDAYPEIFVGRISAESTDHVITQVNRLLEYEKVLSTTGLSTYNQAIGIASNQGPGDDNEYDWQHERNIRTQLLAYTYTNVAELYDGSQGGNDAAGNPVAADVTTLVNSGVGLINYTGHGSTTSIVTSNFTNTNVDQLKNAHKYPFIWTVGCVTGEFMNGTCFAEAWARAKDDQTGVPTGSIVNFMSTINQSWDPPMEAQDEFNAILTENVTNNIRRSFGGISYNGCMKMNDTYGAQGAEMTDTWTVFGDPTTLIFTAPPTSMTVTHAPTMVLGSASFTVNCNVNDALICLTQNGEILDVQKVVNNVANFSFAPLVSVNPVKVTATAFNHVPYQQEVQVTVPNGPYVIVPTLTINDANGNNNQKADYGETILLNIDLQNVGIQTANATQVTISTANTNVSFTDATESTGNINASATNTFNNVFALSVANDVIDQTVVNFTLNVSDNNGNTWVSPANIVLNAPILKVLDWTIDDSQGNNNGLLDAGETVTITVKNINVGHADASGAVGVLSVNNPDVLIQTPSFPLGTLVVNTITSATFTITIGANVPKGTVLTFTYQSNAGTVYTAQATHNEKVSPDVITFEPNSSLTPNFTQVGPNPWFVSNTIYYQGNNSYQSGDISNSQSTSMAMGWNVTQADSVSFYVKTSSEADWDFLYFYVDGVEQGNWSGELSWQKVSYALPLGAHTLKWEYKKDAFQSDGADAAWVDYIMLPVGTPFNVGNETASAAHFISVYPNPAHDKLTIEMENPMNGAVNIQLLNVNGQCVLKQLYKEGTTTAILPLTALSKGMYFLRVEVGDKMSVEKVIVE